MNKEYLDFIDFVFETCDFKYDNDLYELARRFRKNQGVILNNDDVDYLIDYYKNDLFEHIPDRYPHVVKLTINANYIKRNYSSFTNYYNQQISNQIESDKIENTKNEIVKLNKENLELQNKKLKRDFFIAIISMIIGALISNIKDIFVYIQVLIAPLLK